MSDAIRSGGLDTLSASLDRSYITPSTNEGLIAFQYPEKPDLAPHSTGEAFVTNGGTFVYQPVHRYRATRGNWTVAYGPDDLRINPATGAVSLDTSLMPTVQGQRPNQSVYVGIRLTNRMGYDEMVFVLHIGKTAGQIKYIGPTRTHVSQSSLSLSGTVQAGDTVIIDDGTYGGADNVLGWANGVHQQYPGGSAAGYTDVIAATPGKWIIDGEGTQSRGIHLVGDEATASWVNGGALAGSYRNYTQIQGVRTINHIGGAVFAGFCAYITFRYMWVGDSSDFGGTHGSTSISFTNSHHCIGEYLFPQGYGRYKLSTYQSDDVIYRRCVVRFTPYFGDEPATAGLSFYRARRCSAQNIYVLDSHQEEYNMQLPPASRTQAFQIASTEAYDYSYDNFFDRCAAIGVDTGFVHAFGNLVPLGELGVVVRDFVGFDSVIHHRTDQGRGLSDGSAHMYHERCTFRDVNASRDPDDIGFIYGGNMRNFTRCILDRIGINDAGIVEAQRQLFYPFAQNGFSENRVDFCSITRFAGAMATWQSQAVFITNAIDIDATPTNGMRYLGRLEAGSPLALADCGAQNTLLKRGKLGTFRDEPDFEYAIDEPVFPLHGEELAHELMREYTFDVTGQSNAPPPFDGNFGIALEGESFGDWILSRLGEPVFPHDVTASVGDTEATIRWKQPAPLHLPSYAGYKILRDGVQVGLASFLETEFTDTGLVNGTNYTYTIKSMHSLNGDSGESFPAIVTPGAT